MASQLLGLGSCYYDLNMSSDGLGYLEMANTILINLKEEGAFFCSST